jgi:hypothetical protein
MTLDRVCPADRVRNTTTSLKKGLQRKLNDATMNSYGSSSDERAIADTSPKVTSALAFAAPENFRTRTVPPSYVVAALRTSQPPIGKTCYQLGSSGCSSAASESALASIVA